mgnify:FL=1
MSRKSILLALFVLLAALALAACEGETVEVIKTVVVTEQVVEEVEVVVTETVIEEVEVIVTPAPVERTGAWVDDVVFTSIDQADQAVAQIQSGDIDIYAYSVSDPALFEAVKADPALTSVTAFGSYTELSFNPGGPVFTDGRLNPFALATVREAMNWLVDRDYMVQEIYGGAGNVKYTTLNSAFPDYAKYVDVCRALEAFYAYNPEKANEVISAEMTTLGATLGADGKWMFNDAPVTIILIIRVEDERNQIGDYVADQLESIGFTTDRQYKTRTEASPIWNRSEPMDGLWHIYTGGWITTAVSRDDGTNFGYFYTNLGSGSPLWQGYVNDPAYYDVATRLWTNDFASVAERDELFRQALPMSMKDSYRVWLVDQISFSPFNADVQVAYDLAGGISGTTLWPFTVRWAGQEGGTVRIAQPGILVEPWNPVSGSNWIYDTMPRRATQDYGVIADPYTGLVWPQRLQTADVTVQEGLPVGQTLDWFTLTTAAEIAVPAEAWADWDAVNQRFITVGEKFPEGVTALVKSTVVYEDDLFETVTWHDGSPMSMGDFVMNMVMTFDRGKAESAIYDEAYVPSLDAYLSHFKGVQVTSTDPLTIVTYDDLYYLDAEYIITTWWPQYGFGDAPWQTIGLGVRAETAKLATFSTDKASVVAAENEAVEWMSFIAGPSLDILRNELTNATAEVYIPYAPTMGEYVTAEEAALRYDNTLTWYREQGHFWLGTGPFFLNKVFPIEQTLTLARYEAYPDTANKWGGFGTALVATVELDGPGQVTIGQEATFDVFVSFGDEPYPVDQIAAAKYLLFDATGALVAQGDIEVSDAMTVTLSAEVTNLLAAGANKLEVAVTSKAVSIPAFAAFEFITQ